MAVCDDTPVFSGKSADITVLTVDYDILNMKVLYLPIGTDKSKNTKVSRTINDKIVNYMVISIETTRKCRSRFSEWINGIGSDQGFRKNPPLRKIRIQINVVGQDKVLVVIFGTVAEQHQVLCRGDVVGVVRLSRTAAVLGIDRKAEKTDCNQ